MKDKMKVVVLGAGATRGTFDNENLGAAHFLQRLEEVPTPRDRWSACTQIKRAAKVCGSDNLDRIWTHVDYAGKFQRALGGTPNYDDVSGELRRAILRAYGLKDELAKLFATLNASSQFTLKKHLSSLSDGDALISFNWDTAAEQIFPKVNKARLVAAGPPLYEQAVNLIKPHGSLSWEDRGKGNGVHWRDDATGGPLLDLVAMAEKQSYPQPLVLGALPLKDELLEKTQEDNPEIYRVIADQWAAVVRAVEHASEIVFIGYGFPDEDTYGRFLFREAARRRNGDVPRVSFYAPREAECHIKEALEWVFKIPQEKISAEGLCTRAISGSGAKS
jgi:hypothetical protein